MIRVELHPAAVSTPALRYSLLPPLHILLGFLYSSQSWRAFTGMHAWHQAAEPSLLDSGR